MLLDWLIKLKRNIINVLLQIVSFQEVFNGSDLEYFMILPCSGNLMFTKLLKNQIECISLALLSCRYL